MPKQKKTTAKSLRAVRRRKTSVKINHNNNSAMSGNVWSIPRRLAFPDTLRTRLRYVLPFQQVLGGGTTNSLRFTSNAYDVDPALGSTAMAYFSDLANVYSRFRTLGMRYHFLCTNQEQFPNPLVHGFMTVSLGSTAVGLNYAENPYMHLTIMSDVRGGLSTRTVSASITVQKLYGTAQALYDDLFTGSTTSSTLSSSATAHCYIGTVSPAVPVSGWFITGYVELDLMFFKRNSLIQ